MPVRPSQADLYFFATLLSVGSVVIFQTNEKRVPKAGRSPLGNLCRMLTAIRYLGECFPWPMQLQIMHWCDSLSCRLLIQGLAYSLQDQRSNMCNYEPRA